MSPRVVVMAALALLVATVDVAAQVKSYEAPGNLESGRDLGCVTPTALRNTYTPADLYPAVGRCVQQGAYREAAFLFALAGVYGRYDTLRVADRTAHQALAVLQIDTFGALSKDRETAFKEALRSALGSPDNLAAACQAIVRIGPPDYHPRYMIQHGMGVFLKDGPADDLVPGFDSTAAWQRSLDSYLHCPASILR